jgi:hypothetical protein
LSEDDMDTTRSVDHINRDKTDNQIVNLLHLSRQTTDQVANPWFPSKMLRIFVSIVGCNNPTKRRILCVQSIERWV